MDLAVTPPWLWLYPTKAEFTAKSTMTTIGYHGLGISCSKKDEREQGQFCRNKISEHLNQFLFVTKFASKNIEVNVEPSKRILCSVPPVLSGVPPGFAPPVLWSAPLVLSGAPQVFSSAPPSTRWIFSGPARFQHYEILSVHWVLPLRFFWFKNGGTC